LSYAEQLIQNAPFARPEFLAKKAIVLPNLFRIQPFVGLAQPIPLKPKPKPRHRLGNGEKRSKVR
jgi:hypothetical protein